MTRRVLLAAGTMALACNGPLASRPAAPPGVAPPPPPSCQSPFVTVSDFGATPSDGTDDTSAIRAAIAAAARGTGGTGGTVYFPPGVFLVDTIDLDDLGTGAGRRDGIRIVGAGSSVPGAGTGGGTTLRYHSAAIGHPLLRASALHIGIENLTLDGDGRATPVLQFFYLSSIIDVRNVTVTNGASDPPGDYGTLVQLDGSRSANLKRCPNAHCSPPLEVDNVTLQGLQLIQMGAPVFSALDVIGSNTFMITIRDSRLEGALHLVHIGAGAGVTIDGCDFGKAYQDIIRLDGVSQPITVANSYTEVGAGVPFFRQESVASAGEAPIRFIDNHINADNPMIILPVQPILFLGNFLKGDVVVRDPGTVGMRPVTAIANVFLQGKGFVGPRAGVITQVTTSTTGRASPDSARLGAISVGDTDDEIYGDRAADVIWHPGPVAPRSADSTMVTVQRAEPGDQVTVGFSAIREAGWEVTGQVIAPGIVAVTLFNTASQTRVLKEGSLRVRVRQDRRRPVTSGSATPP